MKRSLMALPILTIAGTLKNVPKNVSKKEATNQDATNIMVIIMARTSIVKINAITTPFNFYKKNITYK